MLACLEDLNLEWDKYGAECPSLLADSDEIVSHYISTFLH